MREFFMSLAEEFGLGLAGVYVVAGIVILGVVAGVSFASWRIYRHYRPKPLREGLITKTRNLIRQRAGKDKVNVVNKFAMNDKNREANGKFAKWLSGHSDRVKQNKNIDSILDGNEVAVETKNDNKAEKVMPKKETSKTSEAPVTTVDNFNEAKPRKQIEGNKSVVRNDFNDVARDIDLGKILDSMTSQEESVVPLEQSTSKTLQTGEKEDSVIYLGPASSDVVPTSERKSDSGKQLAKSKANYDLSFDNEEVEEKSLEIESEKEM